MRPPLWEVADITTLFREPLESHHNLISRQKGVLTSLVQCRTIKLGGHVDRCPECGHRRVAYNSCRNRHCPKCNHIKRERWILNRKSDMLPVRYFHLVFTLPDDLNELCLYYPREMYDLLFHSVWETMQEFGKAHKHLGAETGMIAVLHTWGQNLCLHPHIHCLVPGGGLTQQGRWRYSRTNGKYLYPVKALSEVFRGKFTDGLIKLEKDGIINHQQPFDAKQKHLHPLYRRRWVVYAKQPVEGNEQIIEYLGRYVQRVAISNHRIKEVTEYNVTFSWFNYKTSKSGLLTLSGVAFLRRWIQHVLPEGFVKVRHYGILSCRNKQVALTVIREALNAESPESTGGLKWFEVYRLTYGESPFLCPACRKAEMVRVETFLPIRDGPLDNLS
jgi:hypothetical protein